MSENISNKNEKDNKNFKKQVTFSQQSISSIDDFYSTNYNTNMNAKINEMIPVLTEMIKNTKIELRNHFTIDEVKFMFDILGYKPYVPVINAKIFLTDNINNHIYIEGIDSKYNIDVEQLLNKINGLSSFQAYVVVSMLHELLTKYDEINSEDIIRKVFIITT